MKTDGEINSTMQNCSEFLNYKMNIMECEGLQTVQNSAILQWHTCEGLQTVQNRAILQWHTCTTDTLTRTKRNKCKCQGMVMNFFFKSTVGKTRRNRIKNEIFVDNAGIQKTFSTSCTHTRTSIRNEHSIS